MGFHNFCTSIENVCIGANRSCRERSDVGGDSVGFPLDFILVDSNVFNLFCFFVLANEIKKILTAVYLQKN